MPLYAPHNAYQDFSIPCMVLSNSRVRRSWYAP